MQDNQHYFAMLYAVLTPIIQVFCPTSAYSAGSVGLPIWSIVIVDCLRLIKRIPHTPTAIPNTRDRTNATTMPVASCTVVNIVALCVP